MGFSVRVQSEPFCGSLEVWNRMMTLGFSRAAYKCRVKVHLVYQSKKWNPETAYTWCWSIVYVSHLDGYARGRKRISSLYCPVDDQSFQPRDIVQKV